jgi:hypothetical protein
MARRATLLVTITATASVLAACSANGLSTGATNGGGTSQLFAGSSSVTGYVASNAFSPPGHAISGTGDPNTVRITATGSPETPAARLEQLALARAGDYGMELRKKAFVATPAAVTVRCGKKMSVQRDGIPMKVAHYRVLTIDATYLDPATNPAAKLAEETATAMKAALAAETVDDATRASNAAEVKAACKG